jgi:hypothetical protein
MTRDTQHSTTTTNNERTLGRALQFRPQPTSAADGALAMILFVHDTPFAVGASAVWEEVMVDA